MNRRSILIDCREFLLGRKTGIGRFLGGLIDASAAACPEVQFRLACFSEDTVPAKLRDRENIIVSRVPKTFLKSEKVLTELTKHGAQLFLSPYPKLPLFGCQCTAFHVIHDVLDLTHPAYRKRFKAYFDSFRLKRALKRADLSWYVSSWSLEETRKYVGYTGRNPKVRHNGIDEMFSPKQKEDEAQTLERYALKHGYVLLMGNGLPHKNLSPILEIVHHLSRKVVFVGVSMENQEKWRLRYPEANGVWIHHVTEENLPAIIRGAFCLVQPSTAEGYGYPPLEAMACGVPAIVSNIPVLVETTGRCTLTADPYNSRTWFEAIQSLSHKGLYREQIEKGLRWVKPLRGQNGWQGHVSDLKDALQMKCNS